jgi:hypothetical protein
MRLPVSACRRLEIGKTVHPAMYSSANRASKGSYSAALACSSSMCEPDEMKGVQALCR